MSEFITLFLVILAATAFLIFHIETTAPWKWEHPYFGIIEYQHRTKGESVWQGYLN